VRSVCEAKSWYMQHRYIQSPGKYWKFCEIVQVWITTFIRTVLTTTQNCVKIYCRERQRVCGTHSYQDLLRNSTRSWKEKLNTWSFYRKFNLLVQRTSEWCARVLQYMSQNWLCKKETWWHQNNKKV
jgi:hypothetical protein